MRVLLINSNRKRDLLAAPPIGLCYVAGATERAGHTVQVLDLCFVRSRLTAKLKRAIEEFRPQVIGLSIRNIDNVNMLRPVSYLPDVLKITKCIKRLSGAVLVVGGSGASLMPEHVFRLLGADFIVVSDGEQCFIDLLACLQSGQSPLGIPGVGALVGNNFFLKEPRLNDFHSNTPDLGRWIDMGPYQKIGSSYNVQSKRGCRHRCIYCTYNQSLEGNRIRLRSPLEVVDEIEEALFKYKPKSFEFVDSVFNDPVEHSKAVLEEIIRRPWKADFTAMGMHPRGLDKSYLDLLWRAGFRSFMITPESASDRMLDRYQKGFDRADVVQAAEAINGTGFAAWWFFMIGGPGENNDSLQESLDFALKWLQRRGRAVMHVAHYFLGVRVYPGTQLWDLALEQGFIHPLENPLETLWYLSEDLDLDRAVDQMNKAALLCPEIYLGFDEKILSLSAIAAPFFTLFRFRRPYWRHFRWANRVGLSTGLRFIFRPTDIAGKLRNELRRQGYVGRHLEKSLR